MMEMIEKKKEVDLEKSVTFMLTSDDDFRDAFGYFRHPIALAEVRPKVSVKMADARPVCKGGSLCYCLMCRC